VIKFWKGRWSLPSWRGREGSQLERVVDWTQLERRVESTLERTVELTYLERRVELI
jgi:hypothetical protein